MKTVFIKLLASVAFLLITTQTSQAKLREKAPLKLEELQDVLSDSYTQFVYKWLDFSLGERIVEELDKSYGTGFNFSEDNININEVRHTFRSYCEQHKGVIVEDFMKAERKKQTKSMTCESINPAKVIGGVSIVKSNGIYTIRLTSGKYSVPTYKFIADTNAKEAVNWKVGQELSNGLIEGVIVKIYDTKQVAIQPKNQNIPTMISKLTNVFPTESIILGQDIKNTTDLASDLSDDFHSFGKKWFPREKISRRTGAAFEQASRQKDRVFKGYYPFSSISDTFQTYCSAHTGLVTLFFSERVFDLYCVDSEKKAVIANLRQSAYDPLQNESHFSFSANEDDLRTFKTRSKIRSDSKEGFTKGETIREDSFNGYLVKKIIDMDQYAHYIQAGIDNYKWVASYELRKDVDY